MKKNKPNTNLHLTLLITVPLIAYFAIFQNQFTVDDIDLIVNWPEIRDVSNIGYLLNGGLTPGHSSVYRPIGSLFFLFYYQLFGPNPFFYHFHSVIVHILSVVFVYLIANRLTQKRLVSFFSALIFGVHPLTVEGIAYVSASIDTTGWLLILIAFFLYLKFKESKKRAFLAISLISSTVAYFIYEAALIFPLLVILYEFCFNKNKSLKKYSFSLLFLIIAIAFYAYRTQFLGHLGYKGGQYIAGNFYQTMIFMPKMLFKYIELFILPVNLSYVHTVEKGLETYMDMHANFTAFLSKSIFDADILVPSLVLIALVIIAFKLLKKLPLITFCIGWFFISLLPFSYLVPAGPSFSERYAYMSTIGLSIAFSYLVFHFLQKKIKNNHITTGLIIVTLIFGVRTYFRVSDWRSPITLWQSTIKIYPESAIANTGLIIAYANTGEIDKTISQAQKTIRLYPDSYNAYLHLGNAYYRQGTTEEALTMYQKALELNPNLAEAYLKLASIYEAKKDYNLAVQNLSLASILNHNPELKSKTKKLLEEQPEINGLLTKISPDNENYFYLVLGEYSVTLPKSWTVEKAGKRLIIENPKEAVHFEIETDQITDTNFDIYLKSQSSKSDQMIQQGLAYIPNAEKAYIKIFEEQNIQKMQFYLLFGDKIVKLLAFPANETNKQSIDGVLGSITPI